MRFAPGTLARLREEALRARRYGSVCNGTFALAAAGLLDGRRVATHWRVADALARRNPKLTVAPDRLYVRDGPVCTSGGVTAGMDPALALQTASHFVLFFRRPGGRARFRRGFGDANGLRRAFLRRLSVTPGQSRRRFQTIGPT